FLVVASPSTAVVMSGLTIPSATWSWRTAWRRADVQLCLIVLFGLILRLVRLESVPSLFHGDEAELGLNALSIAQGLPDAPPFFGTGWLSQPTFHMYFDALAIKAFGATIFALRIVPALWGTLGLIVIYFVGRELVNSRTGLFAAALAAAAPIDLQASRMSFHTEEVVVLGAIAIGALARGVRLARVRVGAREESFWDSSPAISFAISGIAAGLAQYFYFSSRLVPLLLGVIGIYALLRWRSSSKALMRGAAVAVTGFVLVTLPVLVYYDSTPQASGSDRFVTLLIFNHVADAEAQVHVQTAWALVLVEFRDALAQFFTRPDSSEYAPFGAPILIAPMAALLVGGLLLAVRRLDDFGKFSLFAWFWITLIVGNVVILFAPMTARIVGLLPAVFILGGMAIDWFLRKSAPLGQPGTMRWPQLATGLLLAGITVSSIDDYFLVYFASNPNPPISAYARFVQQLPGDVYVYNLFDGLYFGHGSIRYLGHGLKGEDLLDPPAQLPALVPKANHLAFVVFPKWSGLLGQLQTRFPGGAEQTVMNGKDPVFTTYVVDLGQRGS